jgi:ribosomal protein S18
MKASKKVKDNTNFGMREAMKILSTIRKNGDTRGWMTLADEIIGKHNDNIVEEDESVEEEEQDYSKLSKAQLFKELNESIKMAKKRITALKSKNQKHKDQIAGALSSDFGDAQEIAEVLEKRFK